MKFKILALLLILAFLGCSGARAQDRTDGLDGYWLGTVDIGGTKLRLLLTISGGVANRSVRIDSIDQGVKDVPADSVRVEAGKLRFAVSRLGLGYEGSLNEAGDEIKGVLKQGSSVYPLVLARVSDIPRLARPQEPTRPFPYKEENVIYRNPADNTRLAGTLTLPNSTGKHAAVVLISGSGAQDRDNTIAGHRPFMVLSDFLTRRGIAVLRFDDRGTGASAKGSGAETSNDFADDVLAGVEFLKTRGDIDSKRIGLIGHSEGGMIAPMVAVRSDDIAFIVLLAGPGQTGEEVIYEQTDLLQKAQGIDPEIRVRTTNLLGKIFEILKSESSGSLAEKRIRRLIESDRKSRSNKQNKAFLEMGALLESQIPMYLSAWFRFFIAHDPRTVLEKVKIPVLAINGENDLQVPAETNLRLIESALRAGRNRDFTIRRFPKLNHLFQTSRTGGVSEYGVLEETIAPAVLELVADWIAARTAPRPDSQS